MKKLALLLTLSCSILFAQEPITKNLGDFNTVKVFNGLTVELQKSSTAKVEITGKKSDNVSIKNSNGILKIRLKFPEGFTAEDVKITLYYNNKIDVLDANEGAEIFSESTLEQQHLEVKADLQTNATPTMNNGQTLSIVITIGSSKPESLHPDMLGVLTCSSTATQCWRSGPH